MNAYIEAFQKATVSTRRIIRRVTLTSEVELYVSAEINEPNSLSVPLQEWGWRENMVCTAASINKLALALWILHTHVGQSKKMLEWDESYRRLGGGDFDQPHAPLKGTVLELLRDMLAKSSNTAMVVLGRYNAKRVNRELLRRGYNQTWMPAVGKDGWFETGTATPKVALAILSDILKECMVSEEFGPTVLAALAESRSRARPGPIPTQWSKHGELNGPNNDDEYVRHEVGRLQGEDGYSVGYAVFTRSLNRSTAFVAATEVFAAERAIGQIIMQFSKVVGRIRIPVVPETDILASRS